jgi:hypothetical protein
MPIVDKDTLKSYFNNADNPTYSEYVDLIDTMGLGDMVKSTYDPDNDGKVTPEEHAASHIASGGDAIKLDDLATPDDNTDLNVNASTHGLAPKGATAILILLALISITDNVLHNIVAVNHKSGIIRIIAGPSAQITDIPFYTNGGAGVSYKWTFLDPDTGWVINTNGTISFIDAGGINTYSVTFTGGSGMLSVQRTGGTTNYTVTVWAI